MSHHLLTKIPAELLDTSGSNAQRLWRAGRLARWLTARGIRATAYDLDAERRRRAQEGRDE